MKENLKENLGIDVESQNLQEKNLEVELDGNTFEITKEGKVKDKGTVTPPPPAGDEVTVGEIVTGSNKTYTDEDGDTAVIPVDFAIVPNLDDISEGLVISDKENDTGDEGNQFVWIPVADASSYVRNPAYANGYTLKDDTDYLPDGITSESENVTKAKGFYISRYEAGDGSAKEARTSATDGTLVSKKGVYVYNFIKQTEAKEKAKEFIKEDNSNVKSGLCTGIQWDMVMAFISSKSRLDGESQPYDVTKSSSSRHIGDDVANSGQNEADRVCNIYDLEGNCYEYVAEKNNSTSLPYVSRGGGYSIFNSASYRGRTNGNASSYHSFRFVLYIM